MIALIENNYTNKEKEVMEKIIIDDVLSVCYNNKTIILICNNRTKFVGSELKELHLITSNKNSSILSAVNWRDIFNNETYDYLVDNIKEIIIDKEKIIFLNEKGKSILKYYTSQNPILTVIEW